MNKRAVEADYLIQLLRAELLQKTAPEAPSGCNLNKLLDLAEFHCVESMTCYALQKANNQLSPEVSLRCRKILNGQIMKTYQQLSDYKELLTACESRSIRLMPLKGALLRDYYPQVDQRYLGDMDFLAEEKDMETIHHLMLELGYCTDNYNVLYHDIYQRTRNHVVINIEIHRRLMPEDMPCADIFSSVWERSLPLPGYRLIRRMDWNDFYLFLLMHFYKHYEICGSGIRSVLDIAVFQKALGQEIRRDELMAAATASGIAGFVKEAEALSAFWFGDGKETVSVLSMASYVLDSGVYGNFNFNHRMQHSQKAYEKQFRNPAYARFRFLLRHVFPPRNALIDVYPVLEKAPVLLPLIWVIRMGRICLRQHEKIKNFFGILKK